jgi:hypothetical protein
MICEIYLFEKPVCFFMTAFLRDFCKNPRKNLVLYSFWNGLREKSLDTRLDHICKNEENRSWSIEYFLLQGVMSYMRGLMSEK